MHTTNRLTDISYHLEQQHKQQEEKVQTGVPTAKNILTKNENPTKTKTQAHTIHKIKQPSVTVLTDQVIPTIFYDESDQDKSTASKNYYDNIDNKILDQPNVALSPPI